MRDDLTEIVRNIQGGGGAALHHPGLQLVADDRGAVPGAARGRRGPVLGQPGFSRRPARAFRGHPGLYAHLEELVPRLAALGHDDIVLNTCITSENVREIDAVADKAREWGVNLCYSAYSARRTGCRDYLLNTPEELATLNRELDHVEARRDRHQLDCELAHHARCHPALFRARRRAGLQGRPPVSGGDRGRRLQPCSMQFQRYRLEDARMVEEFTASNDLR